jgi:hypothetical protein
VLLFVEPDPPSALKKRSFFMRWVGGNERDKFPMRFLLKKKNNGGISPYRLKKILQYAVYTFLVI